MNAFRRQLSASGWQAVGFFGSLAIFAAVAVFWGSGIESDLDRVIDQRRGDHKVIRQLVDRARAVEVQIHPNPSKDLDSASDEGEATDSPSSGDAPSVPDQLGDGQGKGGSDQQQDPGSKPASQAPDSGPKGDPGPQGPTGTVPQPPPAVVVVEPDQEPEASEPGLVPSTLEAIGEVAEKAVEKAGGVVNKGLCTVRGLLVACP